MINEFTARHVAELRAWLRAGRLAAVGPIDTDRYFFATADVAARVILADLAHLAELQEIGSVRPARWHAAEEDVDALHRAITTARPSLRRRAP